MCKPVRLQLSRKKGFSLEAHSQAVNGLDVVVVTRPGKWGNPFPIRAAGALSAVQLFRDRILNDPHAAWSRLRNEMHELQGKNLACWCRPGDPCHADVLLELANADSVDRVREGA